MYLVHRARAATGAAHKTRKLQKKALNSLNMEHLGGTSRSENKVNVKKLYTLDGSQESAPKHITVST
jgi:hypothetical protein